ncbi:MAG: ADP-ribosylglycohydrolase family protein [Mariniphaga sp.]
MIKKLIYTLLVFVFSVQTFAKTNLSTKKSDKGTIKISREEVFDKIYGGWVGMLIGGLEGLPHEFKYNDEPRATLPDFGYLPKGAKSDDDNDFELTHLYFMDKENVLMIPYTRIAEIWKANMEKGIWVANLKAYELMKGGMIPPATGIPENNPYSIFNLSAQFCTESYGLISPGMPQTANQIGNYYAHIAVCCEPIQAAQFWTSLISLNMLHKGSVAEIIPKALQSVDPNSVMIELVNDAVTAYRNHPVDWKEARQMIYKKWNGEKKWNTNSTPLNGGMVILSLFYGGGDFYKTLQYAMAFGLDADCNAATAGAIVGSHMGFKKITGLKGFNMPDTYINKTRPQLPATMKISEQAEIMSRLCERAITENGGEIIKKKGKTFYKIKLQKAQLLESLGK